jgi:phage terminase large subunit-like protein
MVLLPKKNGKTCLLAALALYHLLSEPEAACYVAAASREQASLLYGAACGFVSRSEALRKQVIVRKGYREMWTADGTGKLRVLAADVDTADGVLGTLCLVDELHRHKSPELYGVLADSLGPRQGQMVTISTAGDDEGSPLGKLRENAYAQPGLKRDGAYRYARTDDFAMHEWALDAEDDLDDLALVKTANPASWQTVEELRRRKDSPSMTPWRWARFACGVWVYGQDGAISDKEWSACAEPGVSIPPGVPGVFVGLDLAWRYDTTAAAPIWHDGENVIAHKPTVIAPPGDGTSIRAEDVWAAIEAMATRWPELTIVADPNAGAPELLQKIERDLPHVRLAEFPQAPFSMALAAARLQEAIASKTLRHPDDEELNHHVLSAVPVNVGEGYRFRKSRRDGPPIDALIALAMAHSAMVGEEPPEPEPVYTTAAWQDGHPQPSAKRVSKSDYVACRGGCGKDIHPSLHEPDAPENGLCMRCRYIGVVPT